MPLYQCYVWSYELEVPPYERLMDVLNAFFATYPKGDYTLELREVYKLEFRRGAWKRMLALGPMVPAKLIPGDFPQWPVIVRVLARPAPERSTISVRYELYLPRTIKSLVPELQASVNMHMLNELNDLAGYLAECMILPTPPTVRPV